MREISLLKFYKTGVKSLYSYICNNVISYFNIEARINRYVSTSDELIKI